MERTVKLGIEDFEYSHLYDNARLQELALAFDRYLDRSDAALLQRFELSPETVLVIVGDELVTHDRKLSDDASVEIRPVISGGSTGVSR